MIQPHGKPGAPLVGRNCRWPAAKSVSQTTYVDLTAHPYAGLMVDAYLEARDGAGQMGTQRTVTFRLPARVFTDPLARALIEQRQNLATSDADRQRRVARGAGCAVAIAPERFYDGKPGLYLGLRAAYWGVRSAPATAPTSPMSRILLWQMAVSLEQNGMLDAAAELRQLQPQINQALAAHAPQDVIDAAARANTTRRCSDICRRWQNNPAAQQQQQQQMQGQNSKTITRPGSAAADEGDPAAVGVRATASRRRRCWRCCRTCWKICAWPHRQGSGQRRPGQGR